MKYLNIGLSILLVFAAVLIIFVVPRVLPVKNISCSSQYGSCGEDLRFEIEGIKDKSLKETKKLITEIIEQNLFVKEYTLRYEIPDKVSVYIIVKKPFAALKGAEEDTFALIDRNGMVLGRSENTVLPRVVYSGGRLAVGDIVGEKELFALDLISRMYYYYQVKEGVSVEDGMKVRLGGDVVVIFPLEGDRDVLLGSLRVILSRLNEDTKDSKIERVSEIDLRFKNPVLK